MTNPAYRHIIMIVDRSGSMHSCKAATEEGINGLFAGQAAEEGWGTASLHQFDTEHDVVFEHLELAKVPDYNLVPRGGTALLDAVGFAFQREGDWLAGLEEAERPGAVVAVIATDGFENSSRKFKRTQIEELIRQQQEVYNWTILFLGANMDAIKVATTYGIPAAHAMTFAPSAGAVARSYSSVAKAMARGRRGEGYGFTAQERAGAVEED
ncbi:VWA domain-containing protein [Actinospica durhamensis]|uniref:VWA domain-containing protein n=1 Tax=Actinospica durhamensis TaxID=1508375 RepID=A0A941IUP9_9ACTN|nr:VWA domain-containing protein [Actinospica durhamensis]MBR7837838.1 VWA domain-containing protein [Actinospica durhamensis]